MSNSIQHTALALLSCLILASSCEEPIDLDLPPAPRELVVEAYINDRSPLMNYVILTHTVDYFDPDLSLPSVSGARVTITEGEVSGNDTSWLTAWTLQEIAPDTLPGVYFNPFVSGTAGKVYRLNIEAEGKALRAVTSIPEPIAIDSVNIRMEYNQQDTSGFMTIYFFDPPQRGNNYRMMYKLGGDSIVPSWGSVNTGDVIRDDEFINGETWDFRYSREFDYGDTIHYFLNTMDRPSYLFWDSYFGLRGNSGNPFATPVKLNSTVEGGIGCFTGFGVSYRWIKIE